VSLPKLQTGLEKLEAQIAEMHSEVKRIGERLRSNRGESNSKYDSSAQDQQARHTALRSDFSSVRGDLNTMRTETSARLNSLEKRLMGLEESLKSLREA
jgi:chromosome segregation ATPase